MVLTSSFPTMSNLPPPYDSVRDLGVYDQLAPDVRTQLLGLTSYHLPSWAQATAEDAMFEPLDKAETRQSLMDKSRTLRDRAVKVDRAFERVRKALRQVDAKNYNDKNGKPIPKFQSTWAGYQKRWTILLWGSRDIATKTEAHIRDFLEVIIPEVECIESKNDLADAKLDLDVFIKRENPKQLNFQETINVTQKYSQDFTDLKCDLENFQNTFDEFFTEDHKVNLGVAITMKQDEVKKLDKEINMCETVAMVMGITLSATASVRVAYNGAVAGSEHNNRYVATGVIVGAIAASVISGLRRTERANAQRLLRGLQAQLNDLQVLQALLDSQKIDVSDIGGCIDCFSAIRGLVRHDAESIQSDLNNDNVVSDQGSRKALNKRIGLMKALYTRICDALNLYASTTISSTINSPT